LYIVTSDCTLLLECFPCLLKSLLSGPHVCGGENLSWMRRRSLIGFQTPMCIAAFPSCFLPIGHCYFDHFGTLGHEVSRAYGLPEKLRALLLRKCWLSPNLFVAKSSKNLMPSRTVLSDRRKTYWALTPHGDAAKCKPGSQAESCCCIFSISRKSNTTSLEHNCIPATCCCDDVCSVQALFGVENGRFQEVPKDIWHHP